jgi:5-methylcytosine-specific restriction protein A
MIAGRERIIRREIEAGTGADIRIAVDQSGRRTALRLWFADLDERNGPLAELKPHGLKGYQVNLGFGTFSGDIIRQIKAAGEEDVGLARALVASIGGAVDLQIHGQMPESWVVDSGEFRITALAKDLPDDPDEALIKVSREVLVPLMAAMAARTAVASILPFAYEREHSRKSQQH